MTIRRAWFIVVGAQLVVAMSLTVSVRHIVMGLQWAYWPLLIMGLFNLLLLVLWTRRWARHWFYFQAWACVLYALNQRGVLLPEWVIERMWRWYAALRGNDELEAALTPDSEVQSE